MHALPLEISCAETKSLLDAGEIVLIDCRERSEYELVRIAGSRLVPMSEFAARVGELSDFVGSRLAILCHHGGRSALVTAWLRKQGFAGAQSMAGGIDEWATEIEPGLPRY